MTISPSFLTEQTQQHLPWTLGAALQFQPIFRGGSARSFFRGELSTHRSFIVMHYSLEREENLFYVPIGEFLARFQIDAPKLLAHHPEHQLIWMEDLGGHDLFALRDAPWEVRRQGYQQTLKTIRRLHGEATVGYAKSPFPLMPAFDLSLYQWEQNYFFQHLVESYCQIPDPREHLASLAQELEALQHRLHSAPHTLIHRDFQSQNVMLSEERACLIDFQGLRYGTPFYDLGSLLFDPYVEFSEAERHELYAYYFDEVGLEEVYGAFSSSERQNLFFDASAQRLMQALGAYGYLGLVQGKTDFFDHIPAALNHLALAAEKSTQLFALSQIASQCQSVINDWNQGRRRYPGTLPQQPLAPTSS